MATALTPIITNRALFKLKPLQKPIQAWVETLDKVENQKMGIVDLHPSIFGVSPRLDILFRNVYWQTLYKKIDYSWAPTRAERYGGKKKPWPQKGLGRARQGSIRAPHFMGGGVAHGPRGPKSFYFMQPFFERILGLRTALTIKFHQNDLHIVENLDLPTTDPQFLQDLMDERLWGPSMLFVDDSDIMPHNIVESTSKFQGMTLMPTYGLNVYSILRHDNLILTVKALETIESKILYYMHNTEHRSGEYVKK